MVDGEYRRLKMRRDDEGRVWGSSPALGMDLSWDDGRLRFYDLERGEFRRNLAEAEDAYGLERAARQDAEARAADAEDRWRRNGPGYGGLRRNSPPAVGKRAACSRMFHVSV